MREKVRREAGRDPGKGAEASGETGSEAQGRVGNGFVELSYAASGGWRYIVTMRNKITGSEGSLAGWGQIGPIIALILHLV